MPTKPRLFACPACGRERVTQVRGDLCFACYDRQRPRVRRTEATCAGCGRTRLAYHRRGLCPACYDHERRRTFTCASCRREVEAPASYAAMATCPRCYARAQTVRFTCPECRQTKRTRPQGGVCRACARRRQRRVDACVACGQTRETVFGSDGVCEACRSLAVKRKRGVTAAPTAAPPEVLEVGALERLTPLRRAWVRDFLATAYRRVAAKTRRRLLSALARFDCYLLEETPLGGGQWTLVEPDHVHGYLAAHGRYRLAETITFFRWLHARKGAQALTSAIPSGPRQVRLRALPLDQLLVCYRRWTADPAVPDATAPALSSQAREREPAQALAGLLALVHCLTSGELRALRLADVAAPDRLLVGAGRREKRPLDLAPPVAAALTRYLAWRGRRYGGPSTFLFVSRASRLHDRPVSPTWFHQNLLPETPPASLRQSAIRQLVQALGCDGLQLAAYTDRDLQTVQGYLKTFGGPVAKKPDVTASAPAASVDDARPLQTR